ncbi:hypothetical protein [Chryseobacterium indoltheticum]|uniref:Uncharacterized protein n=1 Tax=Chryseobacterium indoltheticum TaxID=254 RepID=A0A381FBS2_9FLAO|nr:hypothetical protein [Chryseobacterium indoltheticum]AZA73801.1 hypothetical protein EG358_08560 [Chryseobacterium indoltheticum]SIQ95739.1 hypothetical protein SAMN05421682_110148 [Chryseobacterium indoltheticum]SUX44036.1 Uncharacterised protein [Chryseobacterium indoltheticum]
MKKLTAILALFGGFTGVSSQSTSVVSVVINEQLLAQITKNQAVRLASNEAFLNSYEKQKEMYDDVNRKIAQVIAIQQFIYDKLVNVNMAIKQGKRMYYLSKTFAEIGNNAGEVYQLTTKYPQYAVLLTRFYQGATEELIKMQAELTEEILREDNDFLMDPYDREKLIRNISTKAQMINGYLICIKIRLKNAMDIPYIYQIPKINTYVNLDKMIVSDIIQQFKYIFN